VILSWIYTTYSEGALVTTTFSDNTGSPFAIPAGKTVTIACWAGGGGGGSRLGNDGGGGGGGGGFASGTFAVNGGSITYAVGSGGAGGIGNNKNGVAGGNSTATYAGNTITAIQGTGGIAGGSGGTGGTGNTFTGTVSNQKIFNGGNGAAINDPDADYGGGGGGGAGNSAIGSPGSETTGGAGGAGNLNGSGGDGSTTIDSGGEGLGYGGGGGGASKESYNGGKGAAGIVKITYPCASITLTSALGTKEQIITETAITNITYSFSTNVTGATVIGLPAGVSGSYAAGVFTISGSPTVASDFQFAVTATGPGVGCNPIIRGTIKVLVPTPIHLLSFTAKPTPQGVVCDWVTSTEQNNDYMAVERSQDGRSFRELGRVAGQGNSNQAHAYSFLDTAPQAGTNYYRLRQVDYDGTTAYHQVVSVEYKGPGGQLAVDLFPNPARDMLNVRWSAVGTQASELQVLDTDGRQVARYTVAPGTGFYELPLSKLPAGLYFLRLNSGAQTKVVRFEKH